MKLWEDRALIYLQYKRKLAHVSIGHFGNRYQRPWDSLVAQTVKYPPVMQETWVRSLSWEDPLEKGKATHSTLLEYSGLENFMDCIVHRVTKSDTTEQLSIHLHLKCLLIR